MYIVYREYSTFFREYHMYITSTAVYLIYFWRVF